MGDSLCILPINIINEKIFVPLVLADFPSRDDRTLGPVQQLCYVDSSSEEFPSEDSSWSHGIEIQYIQRHHATSSGWRLEAAAHPRLQHGLLGVWRVDSGDSSQIQGEG